MELGPSLSRSSNLDFHKVSTYWQLALWLSADNPHSCRLHTGGLASGSSPFPCCSWPSAFTIGGDLMEQNSMAIPDFWCTGSTNFWWLLVQHFSHNVIMCTSTVLQGHSWFKGSILLSQLVGYLSPDISRICSLSWAFVKCTLPIMPLLTTYLKSLWFYSLPYCLFLSQLSSGDLEYLS